MVFESCPMLGGYGALGYFFNLIFIAVVFSITFWGIYYLFIKSSNKIVKKKRIKRK